LSIQRDPDKKDWERVGSWTVVTAYAKSNAYAKQILEAYENRTPLPPDISMQNIDESIEEGLGLRMPEMTVDLPPPQKSLFDN